MIELGYFKMVGSTVSDPIFATEGSACFDLRADLSLVDKIKGFTQQDKEISLPVYEGADGRQVTIPPSSSHRWMIPTGVIFDIPAGYHIAVYVRGGTGLKRGIHLANGTGIIDSDFVDETHLLIQNLSGDFLFIKHNERLCQAILKKNLDMNLVRTFQKPEKKTTRDGGFNSTGRS